jgi:hypothetical protein
MTTAETPVAERFSVRVYQDAQDHPDDHKAEVLMALRETVRAKGYGLADETVRRDSREPVKRTATGGTRPLRQVQMRDGSQAPEKPDGWIATWSAEANLPVRDDVVAKFIGQEGREHRFAIPQEAIAVGGGVRVRHMQHSQVRVKCLTINGDKIMEKFSQPITEDEEHVDVEPGTAYIVITKVLVPAVSD